MWILALLAVTFIGWICYELKELLVLLVLGYFLAYAIDPAIEWMERHKISRTLGVFAVFGVLLALFALLGVTAIPSVIKEFSKLTQNLNQYVVIGKEKIGPLVEEARGLLPEALRNSPDLDAVLSSVPSLTSYISGDTLKGIAGAVGGTLLKGYSITLTLVNIALLPFIVFYLAVDLPQLHNFVLSSFPVTRQRKVAEIFREIDVYVSSFVRGQITVCSILFLLYAVGLGLFGVDLWLLLAIISGFGNIIPYAGFAVGFLLSSLLTLVTFGDLTHLLWVWGLYGMVQFLEGTFITPRVVGESVGLSPLVVILALFAGGQMFGLLGVFLAVPAAAALRVLVRHSHDWVLNRQ
jgi:predicted PurR-regulated permease PerM